MWNKWCSPGLHNFLWNSGCKQTNKWQITLLARPEWLLFKINTLPLIVSPFYSSGQVWTNFLTIIIIGPFRRWVICRTDISTNILKNVNSYINFSIHISYAEQKSVTAEDRKKTITRTYLNNQPTIVKEETSRFTINEVCEALVPAGHSVISPQLLILHGNGTDLQAGAMVWKDACIIHENLVYGQSSNMT